jgi:hypothetical protein
MHQVEPESAEDVRSSERDETRLQEELIATKEQLRLAEEDVRDLRRELGQSRESLRELRLMSGTLSMSWISVRRQSEKRKMHSTPARTKFTEATQLLLVRVHPGQAESESSTARAEESQPKSSQITFLCAALRERVTELEAKVKKLTSVRQYRAHSNSRSRCPTGTCTGMLASDLRCLVCIRAIQYQISKQLQTIQGSEISTAST